MEASASTGRSSRVFARRRALALLAVSISFVATAGYWLGATGTTSPSISPLPGTSNGAVADIAAMSSGVTRTNGGAQLQVGVALAKLTVAAAATNHLRLQVAWTNADQGGQVLNNPNAQISVGLYHPIHTGNCNASSQSVDAPLVNITDTDGSTYCGALDESATGSSSVSSAGKLLLAKSIVGGYLKPALDGSGSVAGCAGSSVDTGSWCQPSSISDADQRALFLVASIVTPGGIPQGQQASLDSLDFFEQAAAVT